MVEPVVSKEPVTVVGLTCLSSVFLLQTLFAPFEKIKLYNQTALVRNFRLSKLKDTWNVNKIINTKKRQHTLQEFPVPIDTQYQGKVSAFRGHFANIIRLLPSEALFFALYMRDTEAYAPISQLPNQIFEKHFETGSLAGAISRFVTYPFDVLRTKITISSKYQIRTLGTAFYKTILPPHGSTFHLFLGSVPSTIGYAINRGLWCGGYSYLKQSQEQKRHTSTSSNLSTFDLYICSQISLIFGEFISYPIDTLSRWRMLKSDHEQSLRKYGLPPEQYSACKNLRTLYSTLLKKQAYFKGFGANCFASVPMALSMVVFDKLRQYHTYKDSLFSPD